MTIFLASLAGIPPLGGWFAKFNAFRAVLDAGTGLGLRDRHHRRGEHGHRVRLLRHVMREMWMKPSPDGDVTPVRTPPSLMAALGITGDRPRSCSASCRSS